MGRFEPDFKQICSWSQRSDFVRAQQKLRDAKQSSVLCVVFKTRKWCVLFHSTKVKTCAMTKVNNEKYLGKPSPYMYAQCFIGSDLFDRMMLLPARLRGLRRAPPAGDAKVQRAE